MKNLVLHSNKYGIQVLSSFISQRNKGCLHHIANGHMLQGAHHLCTPFGHLLTPWMEDWLIARSAYMGQHKHKIADIH